jgi:hypothetical protein
VDARYGPGQPAALARRRRARPRRTQPSPHSVASIRCLGGPRLEARFAIRRSRPSCGPPEPSTPLWNDRYDLVPDSNGSTRCCTTRCLPSHYPDLYHPAVCYFNSSVAAFVEVAWRWRAAVELLRANRAPHYTAPFKEHERHRQETERSCEMFLARVTAIDSTVGDTDLDSLWVETITDDL